MRIVGSPDDLALSGWDAAPAGDDGPLFALGDAEADAADVRFTEPDFVPRAAAQSQARRVAPAGEGLWRRAPWPVNDALFDLPAAPDPGAVLVVGDDEIAARLRDHGAAVTAAARVTADLIRDAAVVVIAGGTGALPAHAPAVLAARRVLVTDAPQTTFGLQSGIEFLGATTPDQAVERANTARLHPRAMASLRAMGSRAAREHRASLVYPRFAADLRERAST